MGEALLSLGLLLALMAAAPVALPPTAPPASSVAVHEASSGVAVSDRSAPLVRSVELLADAPIDKPREALALVTIEPGKPYDEQEARRTLRNLRASGLAAEAEVWTDEVPTGGLDVQVAMWANVEVEKVELLGSDTGLDRDALRREVAVEEGQPLLEDRVLRTVYRLQDRYRAEGYFEATVRSHVTVDPTRKRAAVAFTVAAGPRAKVGAVSFAGAHGPFSDAQLVAALRAKPAQPYRESTVRDDTDRLRRWLHEQGYRQAEVEMLRERYDAATHDVALDYRLDVHGKLLLQVSGASEGELRRHDLLPFLGDEGYDEAVVLQAVDRIKRYYQQRGHYHVQVTHQEEQRGEDVHLLLTVVPGPVYTLRDVRFRGNEGVSADRLGALMTTGERRLLVAGSGRLVDAVLAEDLDNVRSYYALAGWTQAKVGPAEVEEKGRDLVLTVPVVEGPRSRVVDLAIEGVQSLDLRALRKELPLQPSGPFHPRLLDEALDLVRSQYEEKGYPYAQVSATTSWNPDHTLVDITLRVLEGPRQTAANLIVRGNRKTSTAVIEMLADVRPGEPLSRRRLLEVQRNLYRLGIFSNVEVTLPPSAESVRQRDVLIEVEEGHNRRLAYGLGYDSQERIGGLVTYSQANLLGRALHFQAEARATTLSQRFRLLLEQPYWGGSAPGAITYVLYQEAERRPTFDVQQRGAQTELARTYGRWRFSLFGDYRQVNLAPGDEKLDLSSLPADEQRAFQDIRILSVVPRVVWDDRDDPIDAHRGSQLIAQLKYAFPAGQLADEHFLQAFGQLVQYLDLGRPGVVAVSLRGGAIEQLSREPVAISERFFAGGRTTNRAYGRDELGIPGETLIDGKPIGGLGLFLVNADYRFPIAGALGGTLFVDSGNVWADWRHMDLRDFKTGAGVGLRYLTPVGPLRVEVGWKLSPEPDESRAAFQVSFGNAF